MRANNSQRERKNRLLLTFGYLRSISDAICSIPSDVSNLIFTFYDNGVIWSISDTQHNGNESIDTFLNSKLQDTMFGPVFEPIHGMICQLTLSPNGYNAEDLGYVMCYFEVHKFPSYLKSVTLSFTLYLKELNYEYIKSVCYHTHGSNMCHGWSNSIQLSQISRNGLRSLHIECVVDIIHAHYKKSHKHDNIVSIVPYFGSSKFEWNVSDDTHLFTAMANATIIYGNDYRLFYSDPFYKHCWMLRCAPFGYNKRTRGQCWLFLQLIQMPFRVKSIQISWRISAHYKLRTCDGDFFVEEKGVNWFSIDMDGADGWGKSILSYANLKRIDEISFTAHLQALDIRTYE